MHKKPGSMVNNWNTWAGVFLYFSAISFNFGSSTKSGSPLGALKFTYLF